MTKKQGLALPPGVYKIRWKSGGWSWAAIGEVAYRTGVWLPGNRRCIASGDREILAYNWSSALMGSRMWRKIARVERAGLEKMEGER